MWISGGQLPCLRCLLLQGLWVLGEGDEVAVGVREESVSLSRGGQVGDLRNVLVARKERADLPDEGVPGLDVGAESLGQQVVGLLVSGWQGWILRTFERVGALAPFPLREWGVRDGGEENRGEACGGCGFQQGLEALAQSGTALRVGLLLAFRSGASKELAAVELRLFLGLSALGVRALAHVGGPTSHHLGQALQVPGLALRVRLTESLVGQRLQSEGPYEASRQVQGLLVLDGHLAVQEGFVVDGEALGFVPQGLGERSGLLPEGLGGAGWWRLPDLCHQGVLREDPEANPIGFRIPEGGLRKGPLEGLLGPEFQLVLFVQVFLGPVGKARGANDFPHGSAAR